MESSANCIVLVPCGSATLLGMGSKARPQEPAAATACAGTVPQGRQRPPPELKGTGVRVLRSEPCSEDGAWICPRTPAGPRGGAQGPRSWSRSRARSHSTDHSFSSLTSTQQTGRCEQGPPGTAWGLTPPGALLAAPALHQASSLCAPTGKLGTERCWSPGTHRNQELSGIFQVFLFPVGLPRSAGARTPACM